MNKRIVAAGAAATTLAVTGAGAAVALTASPAVAATHATTTAAPILGSVSYNGFTLTLKGLTVVDNKPVVTGTLSVKVFGMQLGLGTVSLPFEVQLDGSVAAGWKLITPPVTVKTAIGTVTIPKLAITLAAPNTSDAQLLAAASVAIHAAQAASTVLSQVFGTAYQAVEQQVYNAAVTAMIKVIGQLNLQIAGHTVVAVAG